MAQYEIKKCDITIECGATFTMYFVVRDNNNSLVDLTGSTVEAQLREYAEANDYFEFTATHNGSGGRVTLTMPFEDTAAIPYTSGVYDVYITDQNNDREKYLIGDVNIVPAVTKPVAGEIIYLLSFASEDDFPSYGMVRRLYFSHATNHMYRWNGTDYVDIVTDGEAATVEVGDVETLPAGSNATVENVGSLLNAVFDFGIPEGNGIASIEKTGTDVLTDTYTITFTDPSAEAFDFDVTNGKGIVSIAEVVSGLTHTFTVTFNDGDTFTYTLTDGNGIVSIEKTGATDNVDHYRITFDDGTYFDYDVTNVDTSEFYDKDEVDALLADKADVGDSYTKDEEDALLADKADSADLGDLASKDTVDWDSDIDNIPETFPPSAHNHDDRYYTETEMDSLLADKADADDVYTKDDVDDALADKADSADVYTKDETDALLLDKAPVILSSASGSIASFTDGSASPVTALSVSIDPVQDLHGYDNPWPAGGGKNIWNPIDTLPGYIADNSHEISSGDQATMFVKVNEGETYTLSKPSSIRFRYGFTATEPQLGDVVQNYERHDSYTTYTFTVPTGMNYFVAYVGSEMEKETVFASLQVEKGSSATSYAPYSNICPISGHSTATVTRTGKNLFSYEEFFDSWVEVSGSKAGRLCLKLEGNTYYTVSTNVPKTTTGNLNASVFAWAGDYNSFAPSTATNGVSLEVSRTIKTNADGKLTIAMYTLEPNSGYTMTETDFSNGTYWVQLELGSSASSFEPYQPIQTVAIDLDGTRYGGTLDVLTGEMTVTKAIVDLGTLSWSYNSSNAFFYANISGGVTNYGVNVLPDIICSSYKIIKTRYGSEWNYASLNGCISWSRDSSQVQIKNTDYTSATDFKTAMSGVQLVYKLATPLTVQLTPSQISTLIGENHLWADTGDVAVEYRADTKLFVQGQIAETLDAVKKAKQIITDVTTEMVAPRNLAEGDYVIVGDDLLKTTATVASGSALTIDINCVKTTVAEALIALATASE